MVIKELKRFANPLYLCKNKSISMSYLGAQDRFQIQMRSMGEFIDKENAVRFALLHLASLEETRKKEEKPTSIRS